MQGEVRLPVWVERGALRLPPTLDVPLLMVGPGTGVAPFRSFLQHRQAVLLAGQCLVGCLADCLSHALAPPGT